MNRRFFGARDVVLIITAISLLSANSGIPVSGGVKMRYLIENESKLFLKGTTNVNSFSCDCTDHFPPKYLDAESEGGHTRFQNTDIRMTVRNFNCRNRKIETDLQKAMKAEAYPYISIELAETWQDAKCLNGDCKDWFNVQAKVRITITNVTKVRRIWAKAKMIGKNRFQLQGEEALQMSEFGITPPEAMFGLIKVNDWIAFHFDMTVQVENPEEIKKASGSPDL